MSVLTVWREKPGAALSTLARIGTKTPQLTEARDYEVVDSERLRALVSSRQVFSAVHVPISVAEEVLGWEGE